MADEKSCGAIEVVESERLSMRRLMPEDYKAMAAWDMDESAYEACSHCLWCAKL